MALARYIWSCMKPLGWLSKRTGGTIGWMNGREIAWRKWKGEIGEEELSIGQKALQWFGEKRQKQSQHAPQDWWHELDRQGRQAEQETWFSLRSRFNTSISWVWSWTIACSLQHQGPVHNVSIRTLLLFCQKTTEVFLDDVHTQATSESPANAYRKQAEGYLAWKPSRFWL
jgi:hypothetical protein